MSESSVVAARSMNAVSDLLGVSQRDGRRMVAVASSVFPTRSLVGEVLEPKLPATAMALGAYEIDLAHAEVIEQVLNTDAARRITVGQWVAAEVLFADWARRYSPEQLARKARDELDLLDQDGAMIRRSMSCTYPSPGTVSAGGSTGSWIR
jgi:Domain of unknown function (DUF222)